MSPTKSGAAREAVPVHRSAKRRDVADTRARILDAAEALFIEQGFVATSMRAITTRAGVNLAAAHYHFGSKEGLLGAAFGPESVQTLKNLYYMGLEVIELEVDSYLRTAGMKRVEGLKEALNRSPRWEDLEASRFWRYAVL